jgi:hypothetical protein
MTDFLAEIVKSLNMDQASRSSKGRSLKKDRARTSRTDPPMKDRKVSSPTKSSSVKEKRKSSAKEMTSKRERKKTAQPMDDSEGLHELPPIAKSSSHMLMMTTTLKTGAKKGQDLDRKVSLRKAQQLPRARSSHGSIPNDERSGIYYCALSRSCSGFLWGKKKQQQN